MIGLEGKDSLNAGKSPALNSIQVQTDEILLCHKYDYEPEDVYDLDAHTYSSQGVDVYLTCRYCGNSFDSKPELMLHRKKHHVHQVNICRNFSSGVCPYEESVCWYKHMDSEITSEVILSRIKCTVCDLEFTSRSELMYHKKKEHRTQVAQCKNIGKCWFGKDKCWFNHDESKECEEMGEHEKSTENIFKMVETFTKRIITIEEKL